MGAPGEVRQHSVRKQLRGRRGPSPTPRADATRLSGTALPRGRRRGHGAIEATAGRRDATKLAVGARIALPAGGTSSLAGHAGDIAAATASEPGGVLAGGIPTRSAP